MRMSPTELVHHHNPGLAIDGPRVTVTFPDQGPARAFFDGILQAGDRLFPSNASDPLRIPAKRLELMDFGWERAGNGLADMALRDGDGQAYRFLLDRTDMANLAGFVRASEGLLWTGEAKAAPVTGTNIEALAARITAVETAVQSWQRTPQRSLPEPQALRVDGDAPQDRERHSASPLFLDPEDEHTLARTRLINARAEILELDFAERMFAKGSALIPGHLHVQADRERGGALLCATPLAGGTELRIALTADRLVSLAEQLLAAKRSLDGAED